MEAASEVNIKKPKIKPTKKKITLKVLFQQRYLFLMSVPFVIWCLIFCYYPLWGWTMAFQEYQPGIDFFNQQWVGLQQFANLIADDRFYLVMRNTLVLSALNLVVGTITAIAFAIFLNEIKNVKFKKSIQTISYLPHFISWVIAASLISTMLSVDGGLINSILLKLHIISNPVPFLAKKENFWAIDVLSQTWKEVGWNAIIYLAAIAGIDPTLYEAAEVDGAGRWNKIWHITLASIRPTIILLLVLSVGNIINMGFEREFLLGNNLVKDTAQVLDWYALDYGINISRYSFSTAISMFKSLVAIVLLFSANQFAKKIGEGQVI